MNLFCPKPSSHFLGPLKTFEREDWGSRRKMVTHVKNKQMEKTKLMYRMKKAPYAI